MPQFVHRPLVVEAEQYFGPAFIPRGQTPPPNSPPWLTWKPIGFNGEQYPHVRQIVGEPLLVAPSDWVVIDHKHGNSVCKPDAFAGAFETYTESPAPVLPVPPASETSRWGFPYTVVDMPYRDVMRPTKKLPAGSPNGAYGEMCTAEELGMWQAIVRILDENARLTAERASPLADEPVPAEAAPEENQGDAGASNKARKTR